MTLKEWLEIGYKAGFCGPIVCAEHDGVPMTEAESDEDYWDEESEQWISAESCIPILRIYEDANVKTTVESNHAPSVWRATNEGLGRD